MPTSFFTFVFSSASKNTPNEKRALWCYDKVCVYVMLARYIVVTCEMLANVVFNSNNLSSSFEIVELSLEIVHFFLTTT